MLAPFIGIYNGFPHRQRLKNGIFWVGHARRAVMECLAGPSSLPEQCRIFQDGPGEWKGFADGWDPLEEGAMDNP